MMGSPPMRKEGTRINNREEALHVLAPLDAAAETTERLEYQSMACSHQALFALMNAQVEFVTQLLQEESQCLDLVSSWQCHVSIWSGFEPGR
uniref:Uncharacterized protein n=1 Tax=Oryza glumipatula TaxID=40148 RepID=A0A0E0A3U8_9ORYZ